MLNPSNSLSFLRAPLALLFVIDNAVLRVVTVVLAVLTDCVDGYLARRYRCTSRLGAVLDPLMDKFFVYVALATLVTEGRIKVWQAGTMMTRDMFLFVFMIYFRLNGDWKRLRIRSYRWGKVMTSAQFCSLILVVLHFSIPDPSYLFFILFGLLSFVELIRFSSRPVR
ncbi:MAG: CDP-alcohol phosphatidyltransferase family protein [Simkaniaceae bacterium]|nr:CDP-alcohol phosphatidyltransferase family protein [Simkaniaceae bacterium]